MYKKYKFFFILIILMFLSLGTINATDNHVNDNQTNFEQDFIISDSPTILRGSEHSISQSNYANYFDDDGNLKPSSGVNDGDTIKLSGEFTNKKFLIDKPLNIVGEANVLIKDGTFFINSDYTSLFNVKIQNNVIQKCGIVLSSSNHCNIHNNSVKTYGQESYGLIVHKGSNYNNITNNFLKNERISGRSSSLLLLGNANHNYIANNNLETTEANAIYISNYGGGIFEGGLGSHNTIFNNTVKSIINPTSWTYGIQMMGSNNIADSNTVIGTYRGISSMGVFNTVSNNKIINITGMNFQNGKIEGGDYAILASVNNTVINNNITNAFVISGIKSASGSKIKNNYIQVINKGGQGIDADGDDIEILNNVILTKNGTGVFHQGQFSGLVISYNNISSGDSSGILIKELSKTKFPTDINITFNRINISNNTAINAKDSDKNAYTIESNIIPEGTIILTPDGEVDPSVYKYIFNGTVFNVTPSNYSSFFDDQGNLINPNVDDRDILNFIGEFSDVSPKITLAIKITGPSPVFYNSTFHVTGEGVWIENLTIINENSSRLNQWGIYVSETYNVYITNNNISVSDPFAAYGIYLFHVNNADIIDNTLYSTGNYLTYTLLAYGVEDSIIKYNKINTLGTGQLHGWEAEKCIDGQHNVPEIYRTYGILALYSSNNKINNNNVNVSSLVNESHGKINGTLSTNSIVGIDFYFDSDDNIIANNTVVVESKDNYVYGLGVIGAQTNSGSTVMSSNNKFLENNIKTSGDYMATGIILGYNSENTIVNNNIVNIDSDQLAYGITLEGSQSSTITNNNVNISAIVAYLFESFSSNDNIISKNSFYANGSYIYGLAVYSSNNNIVNDNIILALGDSSKNLTYKNWDAIETGNAGVYLKNNCTNNLITSNEITTLDDYAVLLDEISVNNNITYNYLAAKELAGDDAVNNRENNFVYKNYKYTFINATFPEITVRYLDKIKLLVNVGINNDNKAIVRFYLNDVYIGNSTAVNGIAKLDYALNESYEVGNYRLSAVISENTYKDKEINSKLIINKAPLTILLNGSEGKAGTLTIFYAKVINSLNKGVEGLKVEFYRDNQFSCLCFTDVNGVATRTSLIPHTLPDGRYSLIAVVGESDNYLGSNATAILTVNNVVYTTIKADNLKMYYKNGTRLYGYLTDLSGSPIKNQKVLIHLNGRTYERISGNEGNVSMAINLDVGNYDVKFTFAGDGNYKPSESNCSLNVLSTISGKDIVKYFRNGTHYYATFLDGNGIPLKDTPVKFNINGVFYTRETNKWGVAKLSINLDPREYIITAENPINGQKYSNVIKVLPTIIASDVTKYFRNGTQYYAKLIDGEGKPVIGKDLTFNINGVFYERTTNSKGIAKLSINLDPREYIITAIDPLTGYQKANTIKVLSKLQGNNINMKVRDGTKYKVKLVDDQGKALSGKTIKMNINGIFYYKTTDNNGIARLTINLDPRTYIITSHYGDSLTSNIIKVNP